jgi:hypothetical protein
MGEQGQRGGFPIGQSGFPDRDFAWQGGYGVLTFGQQHLKLVQAYIERQKEHYQTNSLFTGMERTDE